MNPEHLLQNFDRLIDTPDAVPRLRRFILDLAVRGKLVEQNPEDEPAAELLKFATDSVIVPFELPNKWVSARAGKLLNIQYGKARPAKDRSDRGRVPVYGSNGIVGYCEEALSEEAAIIIGRKGSAGALNLCDGPSWTTDVAYFLIPPAFFNIRFLLTVLETLDLGSLGKGVKPGLNRSEAYQLPIMVPPIAEQHRIVAKVDELMKLCDELEAAQAKREKRRDRLVAATLHGLNNGDSDSDASEQLPFKNSARFYFNHLPRLTTRPEHIQQLRQTILNLAVKGKLVSQKPNKGSGADLLEILRMLKEQLMQERGIRREKNVEYSILTAEYGLPSNWAWAHIDDAAIVQGGKRLPKGASFSKMPTPYIYIRITDMKNGTIMGDDLQYISPDVKKAIARYIINKDDLYITIAGTIGQVGRVPPFFDGHNLTENAAKIVFRGLNPEYLRLALSSEIVQQQFRDKTKQMAQPKLALKRILGAKFPLPPLAEQGRIVEKVNELIELCDEFEARITTYATTSKKLLEATLHEVLVSY